MAIYVLYWVNKKLRRLKFEDRILLSHRYQVIFIKHEKNIFFKLKITENLRFLQIITPIIIVGSIVDLTSTIIASIPSIIDYNNVLYYPIFSVVYL
jgi:hypothetical protein